MSLCRFRQFRISNSLNDGGTLPASLRRHLESCPGCRQFLQRSEALDRSLSHSRQQFPSPPPWMHARIMANLDSAADHADAKTASAWVPALAGAMGVALLGSLVFYFNSDQGAPGGAESAGVEISTPVTPVHPATVPSRFEQHAKQALAAEIQNLASDISGARKFLGASVRSTLPGLGD